LNALTNDEEITRELSVPSKGVIHCYDNFICLSITLSDVTWHHEAKFYDLCLEGPGLGLGRGLESYIDNLLASASSLNKLMIVTITN